MAKNANSNAAPVDVEVRNPCLLVEHKKTQQDLRALRFGAQPRCSGFGRGKFHRVVSFYQRQNSIIDSLLEMDTLHTGDYNGDTVDEAEVKADRNALHISLASNFFLLGVRTALAVLSGSLSIIVTTLDAVLDVLSGSIIWFTAIRSQAKNKYKYPIGKARMGPLGIIVFSCIMGTAGFSVILEGVRQLVEKHQTKLPSLWIVIGGSILVIGIKLALYLWCRTRSNPSVQAFALDHLNDVVVNSAGLAGALLGYKVVYWLDPLTAILLSVWIIYAWGRQAIEHIMNMIGIAASPECMQKLTYLCWNHSGVIKQIDTVRAYTFGDHLLVEVDIVLPDDMGLKEAHDIGEGLQIKLERLPEVARAYVHLDYEATHLPEHKDV